MKTRNMKLLLNMDTDPDDKCIEPSPSYQEVTDRVLADSQTEFQGQYGQSLMQDENDRLEDNTLRGHSTKDPKMVSTIELIKAVKKDDIWKILQMLKMVELETLNGSDEFGKTPLHYCAEQLNKYRVFATIVDTSGVNLNAVDHLGQTPLHTTCTMKYFRGVSKLLSKSEIDVNIKDENGNTAVMLAAAGDDLETVNLLETLLEDERVEIDSKNNGGKGLEELLDKRSIDYEESLGVIREGRRKREIKKIQKDCQNLDDYVKQAQEELQNGRDNVRNQYIQKIDDVNEKIEDAKQMLKRNEEVKEKEMKRLKEKQDLETEMLDEKFIEEQMELDIKKAEVEKKKAELELRKNKLDEEMDDIQQSMIQTRKRKMKECEIMNKRHREENTNVEKNCKNEGIQQVLEQLNNTRNQLSKDLNKQEMDPNELKKLEEAREMLECPICMIIMVPPTKIWMCSDSHSLCEPCRDQLPGNVCPTCRSKKVILRAFRDEKFASALFKK